MAPASQPAGTEIIALAAQPEGWYIQYPDGGASEVACWGLLSTNAGAVPLTFDRDSGMLLPAGPGYVLVHSQAPDQATTLLDTAEPDLGPDINLGGLYSRKSFRVITEATFRAAIEGSLDGQTWFQIGPAFSDPGSYGEVMTSIHYARARLAETDGPVTIRMAWS